MRKTWIPITALSLSVLASSAAHAEDKEVVRMLDCAIQLERGFLFDGIWEPRDPEKLKRLRIGVSAGDQLSSQVNRKVPIQTAGQDVHVYFDDDVYAVDTEFLRDTGSKELRTSWENGVRQRYFFKKLNRGPFRKPVILLFQSPIGVDRWSFSALHETDLLPSIYLKDRTAVASLKRDVFPLKKSKVTHVSKGVWADQSRKVLETRIKQSLKELMDDMPRMRTVLAGIESKVIRDERHAALKRLVGTCKGIQGRFETDLQTMIPHAISVVDNLGPGSAPNGGEAASGSSSVSPAQ